MIELYRRALQLGRSETALAGDLVWGSALEVVLGFQRGGEVTVVVNLSTEPVRLPRHASVLVASEPIGGDVLPVEAAVWLRGVEDDSDLASAGPSGGR